MKDYSFGNFISELRQRNGLSQFQLGTLVGVSNKAVSKWENGSAKPKIATCHKLALVLGVSIDELLACKYHTPAPAEKGIFAMKKELWEKAKARLHEVYGNCPHVSIVGRFESEKQIILRKDLIVHFDFLAKLAQATRDEGSDSFIFGNINASFVAWLLGITPVNPLEPHYYCPDCKKIEFVPESEDGWDLPEKNCDCGCRMNRDGHSIPCELALEKLNKSMAFDVNMPDSAQKKAKEMLKEHFHDAARIIEINFKEKMSAFTMKRFVLLPDSEYNSDVKDCQIMTYEEYAKRYGSYPHYLFLTSEHAEALQRLCHKTNRTPDKIDFLDSKVLSTYRSGEIPEFFESPQRPILPMLKHFSPETFSDILQVNGLRHATGAWEDNGEKLVQAGVARWKEVIAFSENVYGAVLKKLQAASVTGTGLPLTIMENVRFGRYHSYGMPEEVENTMIQLGFPIWYINSLKGICYLFPKGHAVAYLKTEMRLVWFSLYHPKAFNTVIDGIKKSI